MPHWKLTLAYDGTSFHGWQVQPRLATIQGTLAAALHHLTGETVLPQGSGRTDAGVHALAQVTSFSSRAPIPAANLLRALNRALPSGNPRPGSRRSSPRTSTPATAPSAKPTSTASSPGASEIPGAPDRICPPFLAPFVWDCPWPFDLALAQAAAAHVLGEHDFTSFAASDPDLQTRTEASTAPVCPAFAQSKTMPSDLFSVGSSPREDLRLPLNTRTILHSAWHEKDGQMIYRVTGSGFLHHMVRNLVGTFVDSAAGRICTG